MDLRDEDADAGADAMSAASAADAVELGSLAAAPEPAPEPLADELAAAEAEAEAEAADDGAKDGAAAAAAPEDDYGAPEDDYGAPEDGVEDFDEPVPAADAGPGPDAGPGADPDAAAGPDQSGVAAAAAAYGAMDDYDAPEDVDPLFEGAPEYSAEATPVQGEAHGETSGPGAPLAAGAFAAGAGAGVAKRKRAGGDEDGGVPLHLVLAVAVLVLGAVVYVALTLRSLHNQNESLAAKIATLRAEIDGASAAQGSAASATESRASALEGAVAELSARAADARAAEPGDAEFLALLNSETEKAGLSPVIGSPMSAVVADIERARDGAGATLASYESLEAVVATGGVEDAIGAALGNSTEAENLIVPRGADATYNLTSAGAYKPTFDAPSSVGVFQGYAWVYSLQGPVLNVNGILHVTVAVGFTPTTVVATASLPDEAVAFFADNPSVVPDMLQCEGSTGYAVKDERDTRMVIGTSTVLGVPRLRFVIDVAPSETTLVSMVFRAKCNIGVVFAS